ncbi:kinase-like domain-containing protein [Gigaspora rosea]|uniref:Kinase-like domain-containing protein n=1 Tax=Gigaspora rosea TaxID=44941 RepID=A0A397VIV1_9GLOM|nr:kinase-like domain-containing protein [Gigaspora rosea]
MQKIKVAIWENGIRTIEGEYGNYTQSRAVSYVNLIELPVDIIKNFKNYMKEKKYRIYGITKNAETDQYMLVFDFYNIERKFDNGICEQCRQPNTNLAWCQLCDPWKANQGWTSGNEDIDNIIKEIQIRATEYEKVIEWIPYDRLINIQKVKEFDDESSYLKIKESVQEIKESDLIFIATLRNGIRTIKGEPKNYTQSRTISCVDLMNLHCSQENILDLIENFKNYMQVGKYRIYGITQNAETGQYMLVLDFYSDKRNSINGTCEQCKRYNTSPVWCQSCDPWKAAQGWTSGDKNVDECIKKFQLKAMSYDNVIEWIQFDKLKSIKIIGEGGFSKVYLSTWLDGRRKVEGDNNIGYTRFRNKPCDVALKTLPGSLASYSFLIEFESHMQCRLEGSALEVYGLTRDTENGKYMMVYQYANRGNLHDFLIKNFRELTWKNKLKQLLTISYDLHSGNILLDQMINGSIISYISDLGLSKKQNEHYSGKVVYGVMPYVAPEVLQGQKFTSAADIYSFGVIMSEMSTGQRPFDGYEFNLGLTMKICEGLRPEFAPETPNCYVQFAEKCMNSDQRKRPTAYYVYIQLKKWNESMENSYKNNIKEQFLRADKKAKELPIVLSKHPDSMYISKAINTQKISDAIKGSKSIPIDVE